MATATSTSLATGKTPPPACATFAHIAGPVPLLPRWALGNWWSRYWAYTADELLGLMDEFRAHDVPLSVCIVDMDWHITRTGNASRGWTGYTWNRDLFPDPPAFIAALHQQRPENRPQPAPRRRRLAPRSAVRGHGRTAGPGSRRPRNPSLSTLPTRPLPTPILNCCTIPKKPTAWIFGGWIGSRARCPACRALTRCGGSTICIFMIWGARDRKRPFIFSRWGGLGNHRYPIGFSGDTVVTWDSLAFQPYFTATAANVGYGWWSHDIGGHMGGFEEPELYARWVQFGLFSPILRLHSTNNPFHERRPWGYDAETARIAGDALRLRHAFIPYLYSMAWRNHTQHLPLVRPMYHDSPHR